MVEQIDVPENPVIVTYDQSGERDMPAVRSFGVRDYAAKPLTPHELAGRIRGLISLPIDGATMIFSRPGANQTGTSR